MLVGGISMIKILLILLLLCSPVCAETIEIFPVNDVGGYIKLIGLGGYTGYENVDLNVGYSIPTMTTERGFHSFDTSIVPNSAIVTQIDLNIEVKSGSSSGGPTNWKNYHELGHDIVQGDLTTDEAAIWAGTHGEGGGWFWEYEADPPQDEDVTICNTEATCRDVLNLDGITDWSIRDTSEYVVPPDVAWTINYYSETHRASSIEVTYLANPTLQDAHVQDANIMKP